LKIISSLRPLTEINILSRPTLLLVLGWIILDWSSFSFLGRISCILPNPFSGPQVLDRKLVN
jgi:hypothetical protein